ncbi:MAG: carboxyl transferase domain-containing protein [Acidimicrobiales bacterium]|nr:carboxyl transferase domain-containing protein [Acidimicrobiales bacterium]MDP6298697.1 carboxyl transferase domain-containing protein [Acidimicrobiales bacterium]HJM27834.1 carboxyl transferase domain-containing protein [Acidimicrobiales bacterium]HJM96699.1 carboxyl transferase domain-containing protein [Acidimicrobiales bacterium]
MQPENTTHVEVQALVSNNTKVLITHFENKSYVEVTLGTGDEPSALTGNDGLKLAAAAKTALEQRIPLVCYLNSSGAPPESGVEALHGWGSAASQISACSGIIPTIFCVQQTALAGPALLLGLADFVIMVKNSYSYVNGPRMVQEFTGVPIDHETLGGAAKHAQMSGLASFVAHSAESASEIIAELIFLLPLSSSASPTQIPCDDTPDRKLNGISNLIPESPTGSYDVRALISQVVDNEMITEIRKDWAANIVTALATINGHAVGIVANQPQNLAGTLDIAASQKGARFVTFCDAFNLPIVTFVDTPGFQPGKDLEWRGMIRHGAQLAFAYANATVPRICVTLRKSYGGAYIVMDSKQMGNDLAIAWPSAEIAVMGAKGAIEILHRSANDSERKDLEADYEERLLNPYIAAERGSVDMIIDPEDTRIEISGGLDFLLSKREKLQKRIHSNTPL